MSVEGGATSLCVAVLADQLPQLLALRRPLLPVLVEQLSAGPPPGPSAQEITLPLGGGAVVVDQPIE
jgi:hypothetical protein